MSDIQDTKFGMRENDALGVVEFGAVVNGVLHPFGQIRHGDFQEAQEAGERALEEAKAAAKGSK
jgi:hypothetical protein